MRNKLSVCEVTDEEYAEFNGLEKNKRRAARRKKDVFKARRKRAISHGVYGIDWYDNLHEYSKNKVHCSCGMCRFRSAWEPNREPMQDIRNKEAMKLKEKEYMIAG